MNEKQYKIQMYDGLKIQGFEQKVILLEREVCGQFFAFCSRVFMRLCVKNLDVLKTSCGTSGQSKRNVGWVVMLSLWLRSADLY